ncbi:hypothetical protein ERC79_13470 [Rhodococcus sp. ABRD24]|uniref:hypothetical protein n=1 Tax=Rhodococcus sp. ABRD24 TaxID=2507582 RepID=UPI001039274E|nr:hypothetical protein [Rhodococcus sp. ABRD24]QBJ96848.1 hypothetical protein ERC79_13470 [Rhodococcus sp. ABRD24]
MPNPGPDPVAVAAALVDGVDFVLVSLGGADVSPSRARAVTARARRNGTVLAVINGRWPTVDLQLNARVAGYTGVGKCWGHSGARTEELSRPLRPRRAQGRGQRP